MASRPSAVASDASAPTVLESQMLLDNFWPKVVDEINNLDINTEFKSQVLPLARIKKIMKLDEDVKMISAEAPVLFAKACEIFISELTLRAWIHTEDNKRRTLQKNDVSQAVAKYDQFDFLIDIVPRDEMKPVKREESSHRSTTVTNTTTTTNTGEQVQYYFQFPQAQTAIQQAQPTLAAGVSAINITPHQTQAIQTVSGTSLLNHQGILFSQSGNALGSDQSQLVHLQNAGLQEQQMQEEEEQEAAGTQVFQQIVLPTGEVVNMPIQLTTEQLHAIQAQMQGKQPGQPIVIQTVSQSNSSQQYYQLNSEDGQIYIDNDTSDLDGTIQTKDER